MTTGLLFTHIIIPFLSAWLGSLVALRKFKKERMWNEKYTAYQEILNAIEAMNLWAVEMQASSYMLPTIGYLDEKKPYELFAQARRQISKHACIGQLLISENVRIKLDKLQEDIWNESHRAEEESGAPENTFEGQLEFGDHAQKVHEIIHKYLPDIISLAKADLK